MSTPSFARATIFSSPAARLACATCLKGMDSLLGIDPTHPQLLHPSLYAPILGRTTSSSCTEISPLLRLELLAGPSHLPFVAMGGWDGVPAKSWDLASCFPIQSHTPLHLFCAHARYECEDGPRDIDEAPLCMRHLGTHVTYTTYAMSNAIRFYASTLRRLFQDGRG